VGGKANQKSLLLVRRLVQLIARCMQRLIRITKPTQRTAS